jgi:hypothetical protein
LYQFALGQIDSIIKTPRNVSISATAYYPDFYEAEDEIEAATLYWQQMINDSLWNATIISPPTITYNCHGYAWHVSDGGINVVITGSGNVENYYSGDSATYIQTLETDTFRATLHTQCSQKNLTDYIIWAGTPAVDVTGPSVGSVGNSYTFYEYPSTYSSPTSFNWTLSPYCDGNSIYNYGYWANAVFYGDGGYYQIGCTPTNTCGTGSMATTYIDIYDSDFYIISPNPASDIVTISVKESSINSANAVYTVRVIDMYGSLYFTSTKSGDSFTFPVNNLKNGSYIVQITDDNKNKTSNLILIVKH